MIHRATMKRGWGGESRPAFLLPAVARYGQCGSGRGLPAGPFSDPILLSCAKKNGVGRQEEVAQRKPLKGFPLDSFGNKRAAALLRSRESQIYSAHPVECLLRILEALSLACKHFLVCKMTNDFPAEQQIWQSRPPQGIFALQKSLRVGCDGGRGSSSQSRQSPRKEISRGNLLFAESGLTNLSYPRLQSVQKYAARPTGTTVCTGQPGVPEGPRPSVSEGVQRKPFPRVSFGQFLRGGSTPRFFAQLRSVGSNHQAGRLLPVELWRLHHGKK